MYGRKRYAVPLPGGRSLVLGDNTLVMGILNVTPDSFSDGGLHFDPARAVEAGLRMVADGADILDIGGESTRPGSEPVGEAEERRRVLPVIEQLSARTAVAISIDTYRSGVAREALARGAVIVNDVSGLQYDQELGVVAARHGAALVLMHTRGRSREMYEHAVYTDVVAEVRSELAAAIERAVAAGMRRDALIVDPGFGFAKRPEHSFELLARFQELTALERPILSGPSRKSFLKDALGERTPHEREWGTAAAVAASILGGCHIVRVHAVREMVDVVRVADRVRRPSRI